MYAHALIFVMWRSCRCIHPANTDVGQLVSRRCTEITTSWWAGHVVRASIIDESISIWGTIHKWELSQDQHVSTAAGANSQCA